VQLFLSLPFKWISITTLWNDNVPFIPLLLSRQYVIKPLILQLIKNNNWVGNSQNIVSSCICNFRNKVKQNNNSSIASDVFKNLKNLKKFWRNNEVLWSNYECNQSQFRFKHFFPVSLNDLKFYMFYMLAINIQMSLSIVRQKQFQIKWEKSPFM
jgi:hypothetical protein